MNRRAKGKIRRGERGDELPEVAALCDEVVVFYLRMTALAAKIHG